MAESLVALLAAVFALDSRYYRSWRHLLLLDSALVQVTGRGQSLLARLEVARPGRSRPMVKRRLVNGSAAALLHHCLHLMRVSYIEHAAQGSYYSSLHELTVIVEIQDVLIFILVLAQRLHLLRHLHCVTPSALSNELIL